MTHVGREAFMKQSSSLVVLSVVMLGGCTRGVETTQQRALLGPVGCLGDAGCVPITPPAAPSEACGTERWVALQQNAEHPCPLPAVTTSGRWNTSKLFTRAAAWTVPPALKGYCLYEWQSATGAAPDVTLLDALDSQFIDKDADCAAVAPAAESLATETVWSSLRSSFLAQAGQVALPGNPEPVRVAIIDAAPTNRVPGATPADRSGHGEAVGQLVNELGCPADGGVCQARVVTSLALPLVSRGQRDFVEGGYFGYQSQIAAAVHGAVADWREDLAAAAQVQRRLVLNLSLGWDSQFGGAFVTPADLPVPVRAVYSALLHARCQGALPIVAAGNDTGGTPVPTGPLFPAAWEQRAAPTLAQCTTLEGASYAAGGPWPKLAAPAPGDYQPLVYSVAGIRADGLALSNARRGARARLAAPGAHAVARAASGGPTRALTGSSVSAAVVSAAAAAAWGYRLDLPASEVMAAVWKGASQLGGAPAFCLGGTPCPIATLDPRAGVRRVSVCASLSAICTGGGGRCPTTPITCAPVSSTLPTVSVTQLASLESKANLVVDAGVPSIVLPAPAVCRASAYESPFTGWPETVCADRQYPGSTARPWAGPQPGSNPCPVCVLVPGDRQLFVSLDPGFVSLGLKEATLVVGDSYMALDVGELTGKEMVVIEGVDVGGGAIERASLVFHVEHETKDYSTESELIIKQ